MWCQFKDDVDNILEATMKGGADKKLMIIGIGMVGFGIVEKGCMSGQYFKNRRAVKITHLRQEL